MVTYLKIYALSMIAMMLLIVGINYIVDPYEYFKIASVPKFNQTKIVKKDKRRLALDQIVEQQPTTLILGTSRSLMGMNASQFGSEAGIVVNASFERATFYEIYRYFKYAAQRDTLKKVILTLDFFAFNAYLEPLESFSEIESILDDQANPVKEFEKKLKALTSIDALLNSIKTVYSNLYSEEIYHKNLKLYQAETSIKAREKCRRVERSLLETHVYFPLPLKKFEFSNEKIDSFKYLKEIIEIAQAKQIELKLVILPMHARHLALIHEIGLWTKFEDWKRHLVDSAQPFKLYDFAYFLPENIESPISKDKMIWYDESLHFRAILGQKIIHQITSDPISKFGLLLTNENLPDVLTQMDQELVTYQNQFNSDYQAVSETVKLLSKI